MRSVLIHIAFLLLAVLSVAQSQPVQSNVVHRGNRDLKEKTKDVGKIGPHRPKTQEQAESSTSSKKKWVAPVAASLTTVVVLGGIMFYAFRRKKRMQQEADSSPTKTAAADESNIEVPHEDKNDKSNQMDHEDEEIEVVGEV